MGDRAFLRFFRYGANDGFGREASHDVDGFVLQGNGPCDRPKAAIFGPDEREFVRQQPSAARDQCGAQGGLAGTGRRRKQHGLAGAIDDRGVNDEEAVGVVIDPPVQGPFRVR